MVSQFEKQRSHAITEAQFCQIIEAILNGKYSWACLLMLQFFGYNPLNYIPYRTYNRLMKEHNGCRKDKAKKQAKEDNVSLEVDNLPHLRAVDHPSQRVKGGYGLNRLDNFFSLSELMSHWR